VITKQNLHEWRAGGFAEWQARQDMLEQSRELAADARELAAAAEGRLTDHLATALAARYAAVLADWNGEADEAFRGKLRVLRELSQDITALRRGDHQAARLRLEEEREDREREKTEAEVIKQFERWVENPDVQEAVCKKWVSPEEEERRFNEIFGLKPAPQKAAAAAEAGAKEEDEDEEDEADESPDPAVEEESAGPESGAATEEEDSPEAVQADASGAETAEAVQTESDEPGDGGAVKPGKTKSNQICNETKHWTAEILRNELVRAGENRVCE
jgi:hypothetical protein